MPALSIVIPAYNVEKYIGQALDSLIAQTHTDWECVVVNDGSTDNTLDIIKEYVVRDPRIRYRTITNSGSAKVPRDMAIEMSQSEWIVALDADDTLKNDTLEKLLSRQHQTGADIVLLRLVFTNEKGNILNSSIPKWDFDMSQVFDGKQAARLTIGEWVIPGNGLIAKKLFNTRSFIFNYMNADEYDTRQMLIAAQSVAFVDAHYYYREQNNSITRKFSTKLFDAIYVNNMLRDLVVQTYGKESDEEHIMLRTSLGNIIHKRILLINNRKKIAREEYNRLNILIKESYLQIPSKKYIYSSKIKQLLLATNFTLFAITTRVIAILHKYSGK